MFEIIVVILALIGAFTVLMGGVVAVVLWQTDWHNR